MDVNYHIRTQVYGLLANHGDHQAHDIQRSFDYTRDSNLDSFELLNFIADVESVFGIQITADELADNDSHTIDGLVRLIASKKSAVE